MGSPIKMRFFSSRLLLGYAGIILVGGILTSLVHFKSNKDYETALERYKQLSQIEAEQAAKNMSYSLKQVYGQYFSCCCCG